MYFLDRWDWLPEDDPLVREMAREAAKEGQHDIAQKIERLNEQADDAGFLGSSTRNDPGSGTSNRTRITAPAIPNSKMGPYELVRQIGRGGFSRVYEGYHRDHPQLPFAIKVFENRWLDAIERLEIEKLVLQKLKHPNLVSAVDSGQADDGTIFLVMNLVRGIRIDRHVQHHQPGYPKIAALFVQIAEALEYAHGQDVLHRDLKPGNILVTDDGFPVVTDFGLAKRLNLHDEFSLTATGDLIGTLGYLSPEQADSGRQEVTRASDVYGLGATLYRVLTGYAPFEREKLLKSLDELRTKAPRDPRTLNPKIPVDLQTVCMKCLAKSPTDRYPSMKALADDLNRFASGRRVAARTPGPIQKIHQWRKANPLEAGLSIGLGTAILAGLVASVVLWQLAERQKQKTIHLLGTAQEILQFSDSAAENMLAQTPGSLKYRHERLRKSVVFWEKMLEQFPGDDALLRDATITHFLLGKVCCRMGLWEEGEATFQVALERFRKLCKKYPGDESLRFDVFHSLLGLDQTDRNQLKVADEEPGRLTEAFAIIDELVLFYPVSIDYRDAWVCTTMVMGGRLAHNDPKQAIALVEKAYQVAAALKEELPQPCLQWRHVGGTAGTLASLHLAQGDLERAEHWLEVAFEEIEQFLTRPDLDPGELMDWAGCLSTAVRLETAKGNLTRAKEYADEWTVFMQKCVIDHPDYHVFTDSLARSAEHIGPFE